MLLRCRIDSNLKFSCAQLIQGSRSRLNWGKPAPDSQKWVGLATLHSISSVNGYYITIGLFGPARGAAGRHFNGELRQRRRGQRLWKGNKLEFISNAWRSPQHLELELDYLNDNVWRLKIAALLKCWNISNGFLNLNEWFLEFYTVIAFLLFSLFCVVLCKMLYAS